MSDFGGLRKHEKTKRALVGLGSAALARSLTLVKRRDFPERDTKVHYKIYRQLRGELEHLLNTVAYCPYRFCCCEKNACRSGRWGEGGGGTNDLLVLRQTLLSTVKQSNARIHHHRSFDVQHRQTGSKHQPYKCRC